MSTQQQVTETATPTEEPVPFEDQFYADPANAVNSAIEKHPDVVKAKETRAMQNQALNQAQLESTHPDFMEIVENQDFRNWVGASKIRQELFRTADSYDFESANELFTTWKQINMASKTAEVVGGLGTGTGGAPLIEATKAGVTYPLLVDKGKDQKILGLEWTKLLIC